MHRVLPKTAQLHPKMWSQHWSTASVCNLWVQSPAGCHSVRWGVCRPRLRERGRRLPPTGVAPRVAPCSVKTKPTQTPQNTRRPKQRDLRGSGRRPILTTASVMGEAAPQQTPDLGRPIAIKAATVIPLTHICNNTYCKVTCYSCKTPDFHKSTCWVCFCPLRRARVSPVPNVHYMGREPHRTAACAPRQVAPPRYKVEAATNSHLVVAATMGKSPPHPQRATPPSVPSFSSILYPAQPTAQF